MSDRDNSTESHKQHKESGKAGHYRRRIYELLLLTGVASSDRQLMAALGVTDPNYVRPEVTRLIKDGILVSVGNFPCEFTGRVVRRTELTGAPYTDRDSVARKKPSLGAGLFVAMISDGQCRESTDNYVADSHEALVAKIAHHCRVNWEETAIEEAPPADNTKCVDLYFRDGDLVLVWGQITPP
jgi:hypothetical protein